MTPFLLGDTSHSFYLSVQLRQSALQRRRLWWQSFRLGLCRIIHSWLHLSQIHWLVHRSLLNVDIHYLAVSTALTAHQVLRGTFTACLLFLKRFLTGTRFKRVLSIRCHLCNACQCLHFLQQGCLPVQLLQTRAK
jgi:hypothetical protein